MRFHLPIIGGGHKNPTGDIRFIAMSSRHVAKKQAEICARVSGRVFRAFCRISKTHEFFRKARIYTGKKRR
jgi:hypothetical protein